MAKFNIPVQGIPTVANAYADILGKDMENQIIDIPNENIIENNNQSFIIHEDTIEQLAERIAKDGQLSPCIVTPLPDGKYELVDGRHRRRAVIKAGLSTTKCIIKKDLTEKQKATYRITLNVFRNNDYLPSEMALSLKELVELEGSHDAIKKIADETSTSRKKIYRYLRLTYLIKPLLDRVDNGSIPVIAAVELSYLTEAEQSKLFEFLLNNTGCKITTAIAREIKENPSDLNSIFYPAKVDNLSTFSDTAVYDEVPEIEKATEVEAEQFDDTNHSQTNEDYQSNSTASVDVSKEDIEITSFEGIDSETIEVLAEFVIAQTKVDYLIIKKFYNSKEVVKYFYDNYGKCFAGGVTHYNGHSILFSWNTYKGFFKWNYNQKSYVVKPAVLENIIRLYIREKYSFDRIIEILNKAEKQGGD